MNIRSMLRLSVMVMLVAAGGLRALCAEEVSTVQPKIMVVPYVKEGEDIRTIIEQDPAIRIVMSKIREAFDARGFTTVDFETKLKSQSVNNALSQDARSDLKTMIIQGSGADIYVETEYIYDTSASGSSVKVLMKACDVSTGNALASKDAFSGLFRTTDVGRLAGAAVEKVADEFLTVINSKFSDMIANGRSINVNFKVSPDADYNLQKEIGSDELTDLLTDWIAYHCYKNNYHIQGAAENELIFDDVRIPLYDSEGRNYNINQFNRELRQYLRKLGLSVSHTTRNNTLVITFK